MSKKAKLKDVQVVIECPHCDRDIIIPMADLVKLITQSVLAREKVGNNKVNINI